jgi:hypothetical protein
MSRRKSGLLLAGTALLLGLTACSGTSSETTSGAPAQASSGEGKAVPAAPDANRQESGGAAQKQDAASTATAPVQDRQLVQTARIEMSVRDNLLGATSSARAIATAVGGFTGQEESSADNATITLRVPADKFDSALTQLTKLGTVRAQHKQADDVTEQVVDLDSRLATQRASVERMRLLLGKATSVAEIAQIESELTRRESDLESLQGRRDALGGKTALSTVVLQLTLEPVTTGKPVAEEEASTGFLSGLRDGWDAFGDFMAVVGTTLGALLPFLIALGIPAALVLLYLRRRRRRPAPQVP